MTFLLKKIPKPENIRILTGFLKTKKISKEQKPLIKKNY
jgi:hypothetical protein